MNYNIQQEMAELRLEELKERGRQRDQELRLVALDRAIGFANNSNPKAVVETAAAFFSFLVEPKSEVAS